MNAKEKLKFVETALSISYKDWERLQGQYAALRARYDKLAEAAEYALCGVDCHHNRCWGIKEALREETI